MGIVSNTSRYFYMTEGKEIWYEREGSGEKIQPTSRLTAIAQQ
jgi:hypothetical protein